MHPDEHAGGAATAVGGGRSRSPFPPIADYGFLSDGEVAALVAPSGNVEWLCLPRFDGPSVFGSMLDRDAGGFRFGPADIAHPADRRYLPGTIVLETSWGTPAGWAIVRDVLVMGPWRDHRHRTGEHRRAPTDYDAEGMLIRTVRCVNGELQLELECDPAFDYGRTRGEWSYVDETLSAGVCRAQGQPELRLTTDLHIGFEGPKAIARSLLKEGDLRFCALAWGDVDPPRTYEDAYRKLVWTAHHWQHWLARGHFPDHPWRSYLERSALTLKGLQYAPTGALVAAATTSLPETPGGRRNWDYRYSWIRDATFALWALDTLGFDWEANDFFYFLADVAGSSEDLQVMYGIGGERELTEQVLDHLHGYEGARPVRVGNGAHDQKQHDVWGAVLDSFHLHTRSRDRLDDRVWSMLERQVRSAIDHWREPDRGIWEVRGDPQHFTSSKVMCWVALDRGSRLARLRERGDLADEWATIADQIREDVLANAVDKRGVLTQHYGSDALDASLLLVPLVGFLPPDDPRVRATVLAIADELTEDGLVLRYRVEETDDGVGGREGSFTICSFWLVSALVEIGEIARARRLCERLLASASPLKLYAEELDPASGRHLGNFPQAFTHLALINAVMRLTEVEAGALPAG